MPINLQAPVNTQNLELYRVQQRYDPAITQLATAPWGAGVEVDNLPLVAGITGTQTVSVTHNLGKPVTSVVVLHSTVALSNAYNVQVRSPNTAIFSIDSSAAVPAGTTLNVWVS